MCSARRQQKQQLRFRRHITTMQQHGTNLLPDESPSRLACQSMRYAVALEPVRQHPCLCGFATAFDALEHDEESGHQRRGLGRRGRGLGRRGLGRGLGRRGLGLGLGRRGLGLGLGLGRTDSVITYIVDLLCMNHLPDQVATRTHSLQRRRTLCNADELSATPTHSLQRRRTLSNVDDLAATHVHPRPRPRPRPRPPPP
jgi:hypothetical protein